MSIFAISDLHLSLSNPEKSMTVFGQGWEDYIDRIRDNWNGTVTDSDTVLIAGDIAWATRIGEADEDFGFLAGLPGRKLISRGNHDFWWTTINKMDEYFASRDYGSIEIVRTNVVESEGCLISGTRGWMMPGDSEFREKDRKIYDRELARLRLCFAEMDKADPDRAKPRIIMLHYPPVTRINCPTDFTDILSEGGCSICVYGHLHGRAHGKIYDGDDIGRTRYVCTSGDYLRFEPLKLN